MLELTFAGFATATWIAAAGALFGCLSGLMPGLHVNNLSVILISLSGFMAALFSGVLPSEFPIPFAIALFIISTATAHTFVNTVPGTFLGAPDEDAALGVLPAHRMLMQGRGFEAVSLSALGSMGAVFACALLLFPFKWVLSEPLNLYSLLQGAMVYALICVSFILVATEHGEPFADHLGRGSVPSMLSGVGVALCVFLTSGLFGVIIFDIELNSLVGLPGPVLFPALAGLFGISTLVASMKNNSRIPAQEIIERPLPGGWRGGLRTLRAVSTGTASGAMVSVLPGVTSAAGTILASTASGEKDDRMVIVTLSAVNTANAFFVLAFLFMFLKSRSGVAIAVQQLVEVEQWEASLPAPMLLCILAAVLMSAAISYFATRLLGRLFARIIGKIDYRKLAIFAICIVVALVLLFTGPFGILILAAGTFIGMLPIEWGVRRSQCMGVLLVPIIIRLLLR